MMIFLRNPRRASQKNGQRKLFQTMGKWKKFFLCFVKIEKNILMTFIVSLKLYQRFFTHRREFQKLNGAARGPFIVYCRNRKSGCVKKLDEFHIMKM